MEINKKSRTELKSYFVRNAIPTEANFRDFIEGMLNHKDDGLTKSADNPLSIEASSTGERPAIHLYESFTAAQSPSWVVSLLPGTTNGGKTTGKGLGIGDGAGAARARLFLESATGNVGVGIVDPAGYKLNIAGSLNATGAITASGGLTVPAAQTLITSGPLNATAGATVSGGVLNANSGLTVAAGQTLLASGPLNATAGATVSGGALNANNGLTVAAGQTLLASGPLNATAGATVSGGVLSAYGGLTVAAGQTLLASGPLNATAGATVSGGVLNANSGLTVAAGQTLLAGGPLNATAGATVSGGVLNANGGLNVPAGQTLVTGGPLNANAGATVSNGVLNANAGLNVAAGQTLVAGGPLNANAGATVSNGPLNANGALNANAGLTVGTVSSNQNATINGMLTVTGPVTTNDLTVGTAAAGKTLTVNGVLSTTQLTIGSSGAAINGELTVGAAIGIYDNTIYFRSKADHNHGLGFFGGTKLFQGRNFDGPVLFGCSGGGMGTVSTPVGGVDGAVVLDGTNSFVQLPAWTFDFSKGLTIEATVYLVSFNSWSRIIDFGNGQGTDNLLLALSGTTGDLALSSYIGSADKQVVAKGALQTGVWLQLGVTMDASGMVTFYVNGASVASGQSQLPKATGRTSNFIGKSNWPQDGYLNGKVANVRIWQRPLSAQEISDNVSLTRSVVPGLVPAAWVNGLAAFWPLNDATGTTARDLSGKGCNGTLQGKAAFESYQKLALTWDNQSNVAVPTNGILTARLRPAVQTFQVGGAWEKFYPMLFADDGWADGALELEIARSDTHVDSSWRGTTICRIRTHSSAYGHGSSFLRFVEHYYHTNQFVGGAANSPHSAQLIVWLRGGNTTYRWRSNHPVRLVDSNALDSRNVADNEVYVVKSAPDGNLSAVDSG